MVAEMKCLFLLEIIRSKIGTCFGRYDSWAYRVHRLVCAYLRLTFQTFSSSSSHQCNISAKCCRDPALTAFTTYMSTQQRDSGWFKPFLRVFVSGLLKYVFLLFVYVFLLFVHVFLSLSMYTYCCPCILRRGYPD